MTLQLPDFAPVIPEIFVLVMTCVVLMADLFLTQRNKGLTYLLTQLTVVGAAILTVRLINQPVEVTFYGSFIQDNLANLLKLFIYITCFGSFLYAREYITDNKMPRGEYYVLGLFSMLGMMVLVSAYSLLTLYLGLELVSLPLYTMVALRRDSATSSEAAMKFFIMGALASGMLLYGLSMIYGATKSIDIPVIAQAIKVLPQSQDLVLIFGLVFTVVGLGFKLGGVPFHMWVPDVYDGAPTSVTLFISCAPKIAVLGMLIRLLIDGLPHFAAQWSQLFMIMAVLSMAAGNIIAIAQTNIKRMLAYSSIAHFGYLSLGLIAGTPEGYAATTFYMICYAIMSMGAFGVLVAMSRNGVDIVNIDDLRGLNERSPWIAAMMLVLMFSMAGIPPFVGFFAKLGVLQALVDAHYVWLAALALVFAIFGLYYYLRVVKVMYFDTPEDSSQVETSMDMSLAITINGLALLLLGIFPSGLIALCRSAFM